MNRPERDARFEELPDGWPPPGRIERLAAEFMERKLAGEDAREAEYLERIEDGTGRTAFLELVRDAERVESLLPRQVREGTVLSDRYRIDRQIGSGGMGKVFEAFDLHLRRAVAVKVLAGLDTDAIDFGELFTRESELLAQLQHPNIVAIHESATHGDVRYLVMDLVEGRSAGTVLQELRNASSDEAAPKDGKALEDALHLPLPPGRESLVDPASWIRTAARIVAEVARTVEAAHARGVLHRDIKPGNVMLRGDASPVILDFGLAGTIDGRTGQLTGGLFGSAAYVAPEQAESGRVGSDTRTDVYQLGLLLYEFLTLGRAFDAGDLSAVLSDIVSGRFEKPRKKNPRVPFELEAIVLKAMETRPAQRYQSAREFREDLDRFLGGVEAPKAARGGLVFAAARDVRYFVRRRRSQVLVAAALLLGLGAGLFVWGKQADLQVEWTRLGSDGAIEDVSGGGDSVAVGDILGMTVENGAPTWIYALAGFGRETNPPDFVAPTKTVLDDGVEPVRFGRMLEPGRHLLSCMTIAEDDYFVYAGEGQSAGVLLYASEHEEPELEAWFAELADLADRDPRRGVPYEAAIASLEERTARGAIRAMGAGEAKALRDSLRQRLMEAAGDDDGPLGHLRKFRVFLRVEH